MLQFNHAVMSTLHASNLLEIEASASGASSYITSKSMLHLFCETERAIVYVDILSLSFSINVFFF